MEEHFIQVGIPSSLGIGGDFAWDWPALWSTAGCRPLFASGLAALKAIVSGMPLAKGYWLVPDFICPIVPEAIHRCGQTPHPYTWQTPWDVDAKGLVALLPGAAGIIVPFYMGLPPATAVWEILDGRKLCVIEDRCQCVGAPPAREAMRGDFAVGSYRKWLPVSDGAYCVARDGNAPCPDAQPNRNSVRLRLAAALVKQVRTTPLPTDTDACLEGTARDLFRLGEELVDADDAGSRASGLSQARIDEADCEAVRAARVRNQAWLAARLTETISVRILEPSPGAIAATATPLLALPVMAKDREGVRRRLADRRVFCPIHWKDGNWHAGGGRAAEWAAGELSLPIDQRYGLAEMQAIVEALV